MKTFSGTTEFAIKEPTALAIGKFDGLHRGHELLLSSLLEKKKEGLAAAIFTFAAPPLKEDAQVLSTNAEKQALFSSAGIDLVIECPFTDEVRCMEPEAFLWMLKERANLRCIVAGTDCRFGHERKGDAALLRKLSGALGYEAIIVEKMQYEGADISSSRIREAVTAGEIPLANALLGYPYFVSGTVAHGNRIGRTLGIPTMNLIPEKEKLLPPFGVYVTRTVIEGITYDGISNIGVKPTIAGTHPVGVETHLFSFDQETYGEEIRTEFLSFLRPEIKFESIAELKAQMERDIAAGREVKA